MMSSPDNIIRPTNDPWPIIICTVILIIFFLIFLAVIYNLIRRNNHTTTTDPPPEPPSSSPQTHHLLRSIPVIQFEEEANNPTFDVLCAICLGEYEAGERLRCMPCGHVFHCACVDRWVVESSGVCPVCRRVVHVLDQYPMVTVDSNNDNNIIGERCSQRIIMIRTFRTRFSMTPLI